MITQKRLLPATIIPPDLYVKREADRQVVANIRSMGRPGYVLVSRQMGKTNLLINAKRDLESPDQLFAYIDLSNKLPTSRDCFRSIIDTLLLSHSDRLVNAKGPIIASRQGALLAPHKEFESELLASLAVFHGNIVFVLDEIDTLIDISYSDEIFAQIRSIYFARINYKQFERITFVLSGVAEPSTIIKNRDKSPFNIGEKIYLDDFAEAEFEEFLTKAQLDLAPTVRQRIYEWVGGHPRMTWDVCSALEDVVLSGRTPRVSDVDDVIRQLYLYRFDLPPVDHIRNLVRSDKSILRTVKQILQDSSMPLADNLRKKLYLAGIIKSDSSSTLPTIRNKVIEQSLSTEWLDSIESFSLALAFMGDEQKQLRNYEMAIKHYTEFLEREDATDNRVRNSALLGVGECYQQLGQWDKALESFRKCQIDRNNEAQDYYRIELNAGVCLFAKGDVEQAAATFEAMVAECKRGIHKWKACVNYAATLQIRNAADADSKAADIYKQVLSETEDFDDEVLKALRTLSLYNLAEINIRCGNVQDGIRDLNNALSSSNKEFKPRLYLRLSEIDTVGDNKLSYLRSAVELVVSSRLTFQRHDSDLLVVSPDMEFDIATLRQLLIALLDHPDVFKQLANFSRIHYLSDVDNSSLFIWLATSDPDIAKTDKEVNILEVMLSQYPATTVEEKKAHLRAYRRLATTKQELNKPFQSDLNKYFSMFAETENFGEPPTDLDLLAFVMGILALRNGRQYEEALKLCSIIEKCFNQVTGDIKSEFVSVLFLIAQIYEVMGDKHRARGYAERTLHLLGTRDPNNLSSLIGASQLDAIRVEANAIRWRAVTIPRTVREFTAANRNELCPCGSGKKYKNCCGK